MSHTPDQDEIVAFGLPQTEIATLFKLSDDDFCRTITDAQSRATTLDRMAQTMAAIHAHYGADFTPDMRGRANVALYEGTNDGFVCHVSYATPLQSETSASTRHILLIGTYRRSPQGTIDRMAPYFVMQGFATTPDGFTHDVFIPRQVLCRVSLEGQTGECIVGTAGEPNETIQALCYGREAFECVHADTPLTVDNLQGWLEDHMAEEAGDHYVTLRGENAATFASVVSMRRDATRAMAAGAFMAYTPTGYQ